MLNWDRIKELKDDFGEEDFEEVVTLFISEVEESFQSLLAGQYASLSDELHSLKGSAANLGFEKLRSACETAEREEQAPDIMGLRSIFNSSKEVFLARV